MNNKLIFNSVFSDNYFEKIQFFMWLFVEIMSQTFSFERFVVRFFNSGNYFKYLLYKFFLKGGDTENAPIVTLIALTEKMIIMLRVEVMMVLKFRVEF